METAAIALAMDLLELPGDPLLIMKDHPEDRRRIELMAHLVAGVAERLRRAEERAGLDIDERADVHRGADRTAAPDRDAMLDLQKARLAWVQQVVARSRGPHEDPFADTVVPAVGALVGLKD